MLREIKSVRQIKGDFPRRWFNDNEMDLIVWVDNKVIAGFQITFDKPIFEHAITWTRIAGFQYDRVDDGENRFGRYKSTPILIPCDVLDVNDVAIKFVMKSDYIDQKVQVGICRYDITRPNRYHVLYRNSARVHPHASGVCFTGE